MYPLSCKFANILEIVRLDTPSSSAALISLIVGFLIMIPMSASSFFDIPSFMLPRFFITSLLKGIVT